MGGEHEEARPSHAIRSSSMPNDAVRNLSTRSSIPPIFCDGLGERLPGGSLKLNGQRGWQIMVISPRGVGFCGERGVVSRFSVEGKAGQGRGLSLGILLGVLLLALVLAL